MGISGRRWWEKPQKNLGFGPSQLSSSCGLELEPGTGGGTCFTTKFLPLLSQRPILSPLPRGGERRRRLEKDGVLKGLGRWAFILEDFQHSGLTVPGQKSRMCPVANGG